MSLRSTMPFSCLKEKVRGYKTLFDRETNLFTLYACFLKGLIFDETVAPDRTLEPEHQKPKISLIEDPKQSRVSQS